MLIHASCVVWNGFGILIAGPSGSGKSELALDLIEHGGRLVADDQTRLRLRDDQLVGCACAPLRGLIEVRYVGLLEMEALNETALDLHVELVTGTAGLVRLPEPEMIKFLDRPLRQLRLPAHEASNAARIRAALTYPSHAGLR